MKPIIGITSDYHPSGGTILGPGEEATYFLRVRYVDPIRELGGIPLLLTPLDRPGDQKQLLNKIDGLLITGAGTDLHPRLYHRKQLAGYQVMPSHRADFELCMIHAAVKRDKPVLGICGGVQVINVALGGSLIQHIPAQIADALPHRKEPTYAITWHSVAIKEGTRLEEIVKKKKIRVNSSHHQSPDRVARTLIVNAISSDGVIEGLESRSHRFLLGVQWHPELLYRKNETTRRLFKAFLQEASR